MKGTISRKNTNKIYQHWFQILQQEQHAHLQGFPVQFQMAIDKIQKFVHFIRK